MYYTGVRTKVDPLYAYGVHLRRTFYLDSLAKCSTGALMCKLKSRLYCTLSTLRLFTVLITHYLNALPRTREEGIPRLVGSTESVDIQPLTTLFH